MLRVRTWTRYGLLLALLAGFSMASAAERVALVIGNSEYAGAPYLNNPQRDAQAIARALAGLGFQVTGPLLNQSKAQMDAALKQFGRQAQGATAAVVYFAGHGVEVRGQNYLLPTDVVLERDSDVSLEAVGLEVALDQIGGARDFRLVILDACRENPMANTMRRSDGTRSAFRGLAPVEPAGQTYVAYAARAGQRAQDGQAGDHSPYAAALLKYLPQPGLPLERLFGSVREEVLRTTTQTQEPALYGTFGAEPIYLAGMAPEPVPTSSSPTVDHDFEAWKSAEKCGTAACFEAYLEDYPKGRYVRLAKARLEPAPESRPAVVATPTARPTAKQRFTDNHDGTVTDNQTGLIWLKNANCFGHKHWSTAMDLAKRLRNGQCGLRDGSVAGQWRLPSKEEWETLIDKSANHPALPFGHPFTGVQSDIYWSSTTFAANTSYAWPVYLLDGLVNAVDKASSLFVWPVRGGR